jgi:methanogenic corrinoid protein MtbC1
MLRAASPPGDDRRRTCTMATPNDHGTHDQLLAALQQAFADALLQGDEVGAEVVLREAMEAQVPEAELDELVIAPSLRAVGALWDDGVLSVAEEHLATEIALRVIALQRELFRVVRRRSGTVVVLAAVEGEQHVVGLRMAASLLVHAGYTVKQLGPNVPAPDLGRLVARHAPAVVGLTVTMPAGAAALEASIAAVTAARPGSGILVGGQGTAHRLIERPGLRLCRRIAEVVTLVDALVQRASLN